MNFLLILIGKLVIYASRFFNLGNGSTWPGHIALSLNSNFIRDILKTNDNRLKTILIAGTNGKTTTGKLIQTILEKSGKRVFQNEGGANLLNGIASSLILNSSSTGKIDKNFAIFEIDENTLPLILKEVNDPDYIIILNLFRDQLDRYGEINTIAKKWGDATRHLLPKTTLILNADDPQIAYLALHLKGVNVKYFGIDSKNKTEKRQHASDSTYCPNCGGKLIYNSIYFSHLGDWKCKNCKYARPEKRFSKFTYYPLSGMYNEYNANAAILFAKINNINNSTIQQSLRNFTPAFGRQEEIKIRNKAVKIFLSKNPTSFNESLRTIVNLKAKHVLIVLNDRIPDGKDVSWIWDVDFEEFLTNFSNITISGDRCYDMALRLKYVNSSKFKNEKLKIKNSLKIENLKLKIEEDLRKAVALASEKTPKSETLYILPTYSAMLEVRKILTGKSIL